MPASHTPGTLLGVDFTCAPGRRKPIVVAVGTREGRAARLHSLARLPTMAQFEALVAAPGPWLGGFDLPFGLPRAFVAELDLGASAAAVIGELHRRCASQRLALRALIDAWGNSRPPGRRLVHRATDVASKPVSSSPLQTRYVPVGFMYFEGFARLVRAGVHVPGLHDGDVMRVAVEAYPARLAAALVGARSYKNSDAPERRAARRDIVAGLLHGEPRPPGLTLEASRTLRAALIDDASGDSLDAVLCLMKAAMAAGQPRFGMPSDADPIEGWIVGWGPA